MNEVEMVNEIMEVLKLAEMVGLDEDKLKALKTDLEQACKDDMQKQCNYKQNKLSALLNQK